MSSPPPAQATRPRFEWARVNLVVAVLIWLMIYPMMLKVDPSCLHEVGRKPRGLALTLAVNWLIKSFTMAALGVLFFQHVFAGLVPPADAQQYIAGMILLGVAPCTAMVFVWSHLTGGDANYTLVQVSVNDLVLVFAFAPIAGLLLGVTDLHVPWETLLASVVIFVVIPLGAGMLTHKRLKRSGGAEDIAARCELHRDGTRRLLRALGELQLTSLQNDRWELTARGAFLRPDHPLTLADAAREYAGPLSRMWGSLADALRAGSGWIAPDVFGEVARDEARREGHHRMLRSYARHDYPAVARALALRGDERIIDAGGGLGSLARLVLEAHPTARVTVLDRPEVVEQARRETPSPEGLAWHPANLFEPWGIAADAVLLARVLHDWDDEDARRILARAREALRPGGRVFIVEMLLPEQGVAGALCDLHLLMVTGGRERSAAELERLLRATGFELGGVRSVAALPSIVVGVAS